MANVLVEESSLSAIADSIRAKNGSAATYKPAQMSGAIDAIPTGGITPTGTKSITTNGTNIDVTNYAYADVAVPNSYSAGDEGKVVDNGALVSQTSQTYTSNGTYDTTKINSATVNVSGSVSGTKQITITSNGTTTEDVAAYANAEITVAVSGGTLPSCVMGSYYTDSYATIETLYNHIKIKFSGSRTAQSYNVRRLGNNTSCPEWFSIPSGSTVVITYSNVVNASNLTWNANLKRAGTTTSLDFGIGNGTHTSGEIVTVTTTSTASIGCLFLYFASFASGNVFECDITLTVDGVRII